jgi:hypothetical protein
MNIYYGLKNNIVDVTEIAFKSWKNGNKLIVPKNDFIRSCALGDPIYGKEKSIFIKYQNNKIIEYSQNEEVEIKLNKKISIVMGYYNRKDLLLTTLNQFEKLYSDYNLEVVIADDLSSNEHKLNDIIDNYSFDIKLIEILEKNHINPVIAYNQAILHATGDIIIIQNPEIFHCDNIIEYILNNLKENDYLLFPVFSSPDLESNSKIYELSKNNCTDYYFDFVKNCETQSWFLHKIYRNANYHFLTALYKTSLDKIGGFNNEMKDGIDYDDDDFGERISKVCNVELIESERYIGIHQWHERGIYNHPNVQQLRQKNYELFKNNTNIYCNPYFDIKTKIIKKFKYPKMLHLYWDGSPMSYLNYLTIISFNKHHLNWKINIYTPIKRTLEKSWGTFENKLEYNEKCYFKELNEIENVKIHQIDFDKIGFDNEVSEVIKSDYLRYYVLEKYGGVWSDFDIIYIKDLTSKLNFEEDTIIFHRWYYPVGLFITMPNSRIFQYLLEKCKIHYNRNNYQCLGSNLFSNLFETVDIKHIQNSIKICDIDYYLPFTWEEIDEFLLKVENTLPENCIGLHWFNGANASKQYSINLEKRMSSFETTCFLDTLIKDYIPKENYFDINHFF